MKSNQVPREVLHLHVNDNGDVRVTRMGFSGAEYYDDLDTLAARLLSFTRVDDDVFVSVFFVNSSDDWYVPGANVRRKWRDGIVALGLTNVVVGDEPLNKWKAQFYYHRDNHEVGFSPVASEAQQQLAEERELGIDSTRHDSKYRTEVE